MSDAQPLNARHQRLRALVAVLFEGAVFVGVTRIADARESDLWPEERALIRAAIPARRQEFAAGRLAARLALASAGRAPSPVLTAASRAPIWPAGIAGSISHGDGWALAAVSDTMRAVGLDIDSATDLPADILETVLTTQEALQIAAMQRPGPWAKVIFCVKECAYKAQFPQSQSLFGFDMFDTRLDPATGVFEVTFQGDAVPFLRGDVLRGRFALTDGVIIAALAT